MTNKEKELIREIEEAGLVVDMQLLHDHEYEALICTLVGQDIEGECSHLITQLNNLLFEIY